MEEEKDVKEFVTPTESEEDVETLKDEGDDKSKNFAELRKQLKEAQEERDRYKALTEKPEESRTLADKPKIEKPKEEGDPLFSRDLKDATYEWNKTNKVSNEEWQAIKSKVSLTGEETRSQILDKITEAYQSLPSIRQKREQDLINKAKQEAMRQMSDDELDIGGGGDVSLGGENTPKIDKKTRMWAKAMGMTDEQIAKVDTNENPNEWKVLSDK